MHIRPLDIMAALCLAATPAASGQGTLTPPGAPAPTMKTLDQVEARTPIAGGTSTVTIFTDGSYYLTGNITVTTGDGIDINASNVTLDLNGFTVASTAATATGEGINYTNSGSIIIRHGHVRGNTTYNGTSFVGGGFNDGIIANGRTTLVEDVNVAAVFGEGIHSAVGGATVTHCGIYLCGGGGISLGSGSADHCQAKSCGGTGIYASTISDCSGQSIGSGMGLNGTAVSNSSGSTTTGTGVLGDTVTNCVGVTTVSGTGIGAVAATGCHATTAGTTASSYGLDCLNGVATGCSANAGSATAISLRAKIASGCALGTGATSITHNVNSF